MHWFWRATIAVGAALAVVMCVYGVTFNVSFAVLPLPWRKFYGSSMLLVVVGGVRGSVVALAVHGYLTRRYSPQAALERETRCRKCGYILRGITEPRCSECGERI